MYFISDWIDGENLELLCKIISQHGCEEKKIQYVLLVFEKRELLYYQELQRTVFSVKHMSNFTIELNKKITFFTAKRDIAPFIVPELSLDVREFVEKELMETACSRDFYVFLEFDRQNVTLKIKLFDEHQWFIGFLSTGNFTIQEIISQPSTRKSNPYRKRIDFMTKPFRLLRKKSENGDV